MRLIDVDALGIGFANREVFKDPLYADGWNSAVSMINDAPSIDAVPVMHGRWVARYTADFETNEDVCSNCGFGALHYGYGDYNVARTNYCPNCGAKMDEEISK